LKPRNPIFGKNINQKLTKQKEAFFMSDNLHLKDRGKPSLSHIGAAIKLLRARGAESFVIISCLFWLVILVDNNYS
jgi:hypothetical protein